MLLEIEVFVSFPEIIKDLLLPLIQYLLQLLASFLSLPSIFLSCVVHHAARILAKLVESVYKLLYSSILSI